MFSLYMSYLCQNIKLLANKLDKLRIFWLFDYSFTKIAKSSSTVIRQTPPPPPPAPPTRPLPPKKKLCRLGVSNLKSHKSCGHPPSLNGVLRKNT